MTTGTEHSVDNQVGAFAPVFSACAATAVRMAWTERRPVAGGIEGGITGIGLRAQGDHLMGIVGASCLTYILHYPIRHLSGVLLLGYIKHCLPLWHNGILPAGLVDVRQLLSLQQKNVVLKGRYAAVAAEEAKAKQAETAVDNNRPEGDACVTYTNDVAGARRKAKRLCRWAIQL